MVVAGAAAREQFGRVMRPDLAVDAVRPRRAESTAVTHGKRAGRVGTDGRVDERSARISGVLHDEVDDTVDGVGAPQGATGPAHHFDAIDVGDDEVLRFPEDTGKHGGVNGSPVNHHQHLVGRGDIEAACADRIPGTCDLRDVQRFGQPQGLRQVHDAIAAQIVAGDHRHGGGDFLELFRAPARSGNVGFGELFDRELLELRELRL
jgi:hypothetical protein